MTQYPPDFWLALASASVGMETSGLKEMTAKESIFRNKEMDWTEWVGEQSLLDDWLYPSSSTSIYTPRRQYAD
jgi:hypothetical protein